MIIILDKFLRWPFHPFCLRLRRPSHSRTESWQTAHGLMSVLSGLFVDVVIQFWRAISPFAIQTVILGPSGCWAGSCFSKGKPRHCISTICFSSSHSSPHGDWLFALPISSCGLKLRDQALRVAVGMRLGMNICAHVFVAVVHKSTRVALTV